jgi:RNA polymerase sigma factor (sigma-70 family)
MAADHLNRVIQELRRAAIGTACLNDGQLLECFVVGRENAALEALVRRHGPMVWSVCRRILQDHHDAEDAYQATFLVLVRRAARVVPREMVANWLYGVAHKTALSARAALAKRRTREKQARLRPEPAAVEHALWNDLAPLLDQELSRLPDRYRIAIILCDLEGKTRKTAARTLGVPEGTVASRLARAREMLAKRLSRRGLILTGAALSVLMANKAAASVPFAAVAATIKAVTCVAARQASSLISVEVAALTEGVLKAMFLTKLTRTTVVLLVVGIAVLGGGLLQQRMALGQGEDGAALGREEAGKPALVAHVGAQSKNPKNDQKAENQDDAKAEIANLRAEIADLRKEIKSLHDAIRPTVVPKVADPRFAVPKEWEPRFRGKPLAYWLYEFHDADPKIRGEAVEALGYLAQKNNELLALLVNSLSEVERDVDVSNKSVLAFRYLGEESVPALTGLLKDKSSPSGRRNAVCALCMMGPKAKAAVPLLIQALNDEDLRENAVGALFSIGPSAKSAIPALIKILEPSIQTFKADNEKQSWWKEPRQPGNQPFPDMIFTTLLRIDPKIRNLLPNDFDRSVSTASRNEELVSLWQQGYEALKSKHEKDK